MPTKPNKAGQQQNYVPAGNGDASGEYGDNESGSNIHFTNFKKPEENAKFSSFGKEKELGVQITDNGEQPKIDTIKPTYNGKGKEQLAKTLTGRLPKGKNAKLLVSQLEDADDELSGLVSDFYLANPKIEIKLGKNLSSEYRVVTYHNYFTGVETKTYEVKVGQGAFDGSNNYAKGDVFFHESGHAVDYSYINDNGVRGNWSVDYKSKKYGKSIAEMIYDEMNLNIGKEGIKQLQEQIKSEENELSLSKLWTKELDAEYEYVKIKTKDLFDKINNEPEIKQRSEELNKIGSEILKLNEQYKKMPAYVNGQVNTERQKVWNAGYDKKQEYLKKSAENREFYNNLIATKYPQYEEMEKRRNELMDQKFAAKDKAHGLINVKYGDLSDMCQASLGVTLNGMGHGNMHWFERDRGTEAFAEITAAIATNPESLSLMKKYIPKTLEIYDEIIKEIKGGSKNQYRKE